MREPEWGGVFAVSEMPDPKFTQEKIHQNISLLR